ncbi:MAG: phosphatidate cytidylyltransferase [Alistipes sp.]|nr:phosphatidate cytidylyltransferase [Alistipes sp.]
MNDKLKNLMIRAVSGIGLTVVVLGGVLWSQWSLFALLLLMVVAGVTEFYRLAERQAVQPQRALGLLMSILLVVLNFAFVSEDIEVLGAQNRLFVCGLAMLLLLVPMLFICELYRKGVNPLANIAATLLGVFYVALPLSLMLYMPLIGSAAWNPWVLIVYIVIVWSNDVFAYLFGMTFGRHRLFERLSPKKSWEGFVGGLVGAVVAGVVAAHLMEQSMVVWAALALLISVTAVLGDLAESMFKRAADVKDSGALIPGHGGVLDRFDALLLSAPFVFVYMLFVF